MVKKSYQKNIFRTVRSSLSRFLAIFAIVALGAGFFAGVMASPLDMRVTADTYMDQCALYDLRVVSTQGLTEGDMEALASLEGIETVMPAYDVDLVMHSSAGDAYTTRIHSLPPKGYEELNRLVLYEGRLPEKAGECVVLVTNTFKEGTDWVGQTLEVDEEEDIEGLPQTLTVVGTARSAVYISLENERTTAGTGSVELKLATPAGTFQQDYYTAAYLSVSGGMEENAFYSGYDALVNAVEEKLEPLGEDRAQIRYEEIVEEAEAELQDAQDEYDEAEADAETELSDARKKLTDAEQEISENEQKLLDAKKELEDGRQELEDGRAKLQSETTSAREEISSGRAQISQYQAQISSGRVQLDQAQAQLTAGYAQLEASEKELAGAKAQLDETSVQLQGVRQGKAALDQLAEQLGLPPSDGSDQGALALIAAISEASPEAGAQFGELKAGLEALAAQGTDSIKAQAALDAGLKEYEAGLAQTKASREKLNSSQAQVTAQRNQLQSQQAQLNAQLSQLNQAEATLESTVRDTEKKLADAEKELEEGHAEYEDGLQKLEEAKTEFSDGWKEYREGEEEAEKELSDAREKLSDAREEIDGIEAGEWYIFTRDDNAGFASYASNADKIAAIAAVFPVFFFLVAALVALTTMTRMVEEERLQIGTMKALGYSSVQIAGKYLLYAALASLTGSVAGVAAGMWLFPTVIGNAYNIMYDLPGFLTPFSWPLALASTVASTLCTLAATLSACWNALREPPARLMLPRAPKAGKRILLEHVTPVWRRMKFTHKVTARNLFRYKKRFFMTILGIAGCTALLVTGFGIRDSISDIVGLQYGELSNYQLIVGLQHESALDGSGLREILGDPELVTDYLPTLQESGSVVPKGDCPADDVTIFVPSDTARLPDFFQFRHRTDDVPVEYGENAVIITEKLAERQRLSVGDSLTVRNQDEREAEFIITDICENYVYHNLFLSPAAYREAFGSAPEMNALLCRLPEDGPRDGIDSLTTQLLKCQGVAMTTSTEELSRSFQNSISSINYIVVVLIVSAGALAFVVLYNLTNINLTERVKELATIKVLGFYDGEVAAYIYRETASLTVIGTAVGLGLGVALHQFVIRTAEVDMVMFGRQIYPMSFVFAAVLTVLFSVLVNLVMYKKLTSISMVESMKAPE